MTHRLVCKHGNEMGITVDPADVYIDGAYAGKDMIIQRITMPVCDLCMLEAVGLGESPRPARLETGDTK